MNALVFRFSVGLVGSLCFTACTPLLGDFEDCATNVDCWETYERSDLICRDRQCVVHELHEKCTTVIGDDSADKDDSDLITFGAIMTMTDADTGEPSPMGGTPLESPRLGLPPLQSVGRHRRKESAGSNLRSPKRQRTRRGFSEVFN